MTTAGIFSRLFSCAAVFVCFVSIALSQRRPPPPTAPRPQSFFVTSYSGPSRDSGKSRLILMYRIPKHFLVFTRNDGARPGEEYSARCEISIELHDAAAAPIVQKLSSRTLYSSDNSEKTPDTLSITGGFTFDVPPATYSGRFEVNDVESKRMYRDDSLKVTVRNFPADSAAISDILFSAESASADSSEIVPMMYGTTLPFGRNAECSFQISGLVPSNDARIICEISRPAPGDAPGVTLVHDTLSGRFLRQSRPWSFAEQQGFVGGDGDVMQKTFEGKCTLRLDTLDQGPYVIELRLAGGTERSVRQRVTIRWIGMPVSLRSFVTAIAPMKYVLTEDEFQELTAGNDEEQRKRFEAYWKKHDTSPGTAFNEMMEEFYKRVDHTTTAFATLKEPNGMRSDRGKVYILYGPPERVDRKLIPSAAPQEIWYYDRLKKKVIFLDPTRAGEYKLQGMEAL